MMIVLTHIKISSCNKEFPSLINNKKSIYSVIKAYIKYNQSLIRMSNTAKSYQ